MLTKLSFLFPPTLLLSVTQNSPPAAGELEEKQKCGLRLTPSPVALSAAPLAPPRLGPSGHVSRLSFFHLVSLSDHILISTEWHTRGSCVGSGQFLLQLSVKMGCDT